MKSGIKLNFLFSILFLVWGAEIFTQYVRIEPADATAEDEITVYFDASQGSGELTDEDKIYFHHGVVTESPSSQKWSNVIGNWGQDDGVGLMTKVDGTDNTWKYTISPDVKSYFSLNASQNAFRIAGVFRNKDGSKKGTSSPGNYEWGMVANNLDIFINLSTTGFVEFVSPVGTEGFFKSGEFIMIEAKASDPVTTMSLFLKDGGAFNKVASVNSGTTISYNYFIFSSKTIELKIEATINGAPVSTTKSFSAIIREDPVIEDLPAGMQPGINYHLEDDSRVTLVLEAPGKEFVHVVGDLSDWKRDSDFLMKKTPDEQYFWLEIENLVPNQMYAFQYWVDGSIKIADPYASLILDPWNDEYIPASIFPDLPAYSRTNDGIASVIQSGTEPYVWADSENEYARPDLDHLMIYELHLRDFIEESSFRNLTDTLDYLADLGINAIELMPISEFEGNDSWGYNPSFYFAVDKYYGPANDLKRFIEEAHSRGIAVILDMVLNHAYGQNSMVQLYFDQSNNRPSPDNPWFNSQYVGPYEWGYDFNHESSYTQKFMDRVNQYWLDEFHFDGYRFDFTKGFTNYAPDGSLDGYDASRISILKRMADSIWAHHPETYIILEHWAPYEEELELGEYGFKMWSNRSYDFVPAAIGNTSGSFKDMDRLTHVSFFNSHDERRIAEHVLTEGRRKEGYNTRDTAIMLERVKMAAAFAYLTPGPKMMWQFDEWGYDIDINVNGRTGRKPYPWGSNSLQYDQHPLRKYVSTTYQGILQLRNLITPQVLELAEKNHHLEGSIRQMVYDMEDLDLVIVGNFDTAIKQEKIRYTQTGTWYDYFSGDSITIMDLDEFTEFQPGEWHIYTSRKLMEGIPEVVKTYQDPVHISPFPFTLDDEITIRFDASKSDPVGTSGLMGSEVVFLQAGLVTDGVNSTEWEYMEGVYPDNEKGQMEKVAGSEFLWEIKLVPRTYFNLMDTDFAYRVGMNFRDEDNLNLGKGFRGNDVYRSIEDNQPFISISPSPFTADSEITITFNASKGNGELIGAEKVYIHSSVGTEVTNSPQNSAWNRVVGNWGKDDGIGEMTKVSEQGELWEISLIPKDYYNLSAGDHPFWVAAVFRNANGSTKASADSSISFNGFVADNGDFFIKNSALVSTVSAKNLPYNVYPNPASNRLLLDQFPGPIDFSLYSSNGLLVKKEKLIHHKEVDLSYLQNGLYIYIINTEKGIKKGQLVIIQ